MKKSITSLLKGWCAALLCAGLTLPSFAAADADAAFAAQRYDLKLSLRNAPLREVVTAFTQQTGVVFSYETSLGERTLPHVDVALNGSTLDEMLASVFAGTGISYKIKDKVVALSAPPQSDAPAARSAAQQRKQTVAGRVTDEQGEPLAGVSVLVKNTLTGTSTDADGRYSLSVSGSGAVLVFMYLGFQTLEEEVGARSTLDVTLRENKQILEEVVVVGYGSVKRRDLIGAVDQVDSRQFAERSNPSVSRSLQGAIPNLNISMRDGKPSRKEYRHFNIKTVVGPDDYASMREVVYRRYSRLQAEGAELPDLVIADGGKGQMGVIHEVLEALGLDIPIAGLAKDDRHRTAELYCGYPPLLVGLRPTSPLFHFLTSIQDEVHRFAISFHRQKRSRAFIHSELEQIEGIGQKTIETLLHHFRTVEKVRTANPEELAGVVGPARAKKIREYFEK